MMNDFSYYKHKFLPIFTALLFLPFLNARCSEKENNVSNSSNNNAIESGFHSSEKKPVYTAEELEKHVHMFLENKRRPATRKQFLSLGNESVPHLIKVLKDENSVDKWGDAVSALGHLGNGEAVAPLLELLEKTSGVQSKIKCKALGKIPFSIGLLANAGSEEALDFLMSHMKEENWSHIKWTCEWGNDTIERQKQYFSDKTIIALGLSGKEQAKEKLDTYKSELKNMEETPLIKNKLDMINGALKNINKFRQITLDEYFSHPLK